MTADTFALAPYVAGALSVGGVGVAVGCRVEEDDPAAVPRDCPPPPTNTVMVARTWASVTGSGFVGIRPARTRTDGF